MELTPRSKVAYGEPSCPLWLTLVKLALPIQLQLIVFPESTAYRLAYSQ